MLIDIVTEALGSWPKPQIFGDRIVVPTQCLTAAGDIIHVTIEGGINEFHVHDDGSAIRIFENAGGEQETAPKIVTAFLRGHGLIVDKFGVISAPRVTLDELGPAIVLVANATRDAAEHLVHRWRPVARKKFKEAVRDLLEAEFPTRWDHDRAVIGHSNKTQKFDFAIDLPDDRRIVFDAVVQDQNSISTAVVRHLDVARAGDESVIQRIVFDDRGGEWRSSDINLLRMGAPALAFSEARQVLDRMAA